MDADSLIKLTKSHFKEILVENYEIVIPQEVKIETVDQAREYPDSQIIEQNINQEKIKVLKVELTKETEVEIKHFGLLNGEMGVYALTKSIEYDFVSTDDRKVFTLLSSLGCKVLPPAYIIVYLYKKAKIKRDDAITALNRLKEYVSTEQYDLALSEVG